MHHGHDIFSLDEAFSQLKILADYFQEFYEKAVHHIPIFTINYQLECGFFTVHFDAIMHPDAPREIYYRCKELLEKKYPCLYCEVYPGVGSKPDILVIKII